MGRLAAIVAKAALNGHKVRVVRCEQMEISGSFFRYCIMFLYFYPTFYFNDDMLHQFVILVIHFNMHYQLRHTKMYQLTALSIDKRLK